MVNALFFPLLAFAWLVSVAAQVISYSARLELADAVHRSLEPAHVSVWIRPG